MTTAGAKAKGRKLQNYVRDQLRELFSDVLESGDIEARQMGGNGVDIILSPAAKKLITMDIECKNQESLNVWKSLQQTIDNSKPDRVPLLVFSRNRSPVYVALKIEDLFKLVFGRGKEDEDTIKM